MFKMNMVWIVIISYALINLAAGILELIRKRKEVRQSIDEGIETLVEKTNSDIFKNDRLLKAIIVGGVILALIYDLILWAPDNLVRNIVKLRRE
jgi:hypothetical protein